jgi:hypothetical protein
VIQPKATGAEADAAWSATNARSEGLFMVEALGIDALRIPKRSLYPVMQSPYPTQRALLAKKMAGRSWPC